MACNNSLTCDDANIPLETLFRQALYWDGSCLHVRVDDSPVTECETMNCDDANIGTETMIKSTMYRAGGCIIIKTKSLDV